LTANKIKPPATAHPIKLKTVPALAKPRGSRRSPIKFRIRARGLRKPAVRKANRDKLNPKNPQRFQRRRGTGGTSNPM
jgi:hypothetical protein